MTSRSQLVRHSSSTSYHCVRAYAPTSPLPEDFTATEAKRVARFVESLAFADQSATGEVLAE
jgi:hypothetical protein